jgi:hypothetical protein
MSVVNLNLSASGTKERDAEIAILQSLANIAWQNAKTVKDAVTCQDLYSETNNVGKDAASFSISSDDLDRLRKAFESIAGRRPDGWLHLGASLMRQMFV